MTCDVCNREILENENQYFRAFVLSTDGVPKPSSTDLKSHDRNEIYKFKNRLVFTKNR